MKRILAAMLLALMVGSACLSEFAASSRPEELPPPPITGEMAGLPVPPDRDLFDLAARLRPGAKDIPRVVNPVPPDYQVGTRETFWLTDLQGFRHFTATATLRHVTPRTYMYVEDGQNLDQTDIERSAREFEERIFPKVTGFYGDNWSTGIDNDPRLTIVNARIPAVAGYFSASDQYPKQINPYSNERKAIYMNLGAVRPGTAAYNAVLAHEFQHALFWHVNPNSEAWVNEGAAELAAEILGYQSGFTNVFLSRPDTQLVTWPEEPGASGPHYGAAMLFLKYLAQHYGGYEELEEILSAPGRGALGISNYLASKGFGVDFDKVFKDWIIANYLVQADGGRYGYTQSQSPVRAEGIRVGENEGTVRQYAADYLELPTGTGRLVIDFESEPKVRLIPGDSHSGTAHWWSNRGDSIDTTLTREFDLAGIEKATLQFWTWYSIEEPWDFGYVEASVDEGQSWVILPGKHSTTENPLGNSFGAGFTGRSGGGQDPDWIQESIDLSAFAGKKVLLRFEYVSDEAVNGHGLALDDISIPELGFIDDVEKDQGWEPRGFVRSTNSLRNRISLQVIKVGAETSVEDVAVGDDGRARLEVKGLGDGIQKAVLVVAGLTPVTTVPVRYRLQLSSPAP